MSERLGSTETLVAGMEQVTFKPDGATPALARKRELQEKILATCQHKMLDPNGGWGWLEGSCNSMSTTLGHTM